MSRIITPGSSEARLGYPFNERVSCPHCHCYFVIEAADNARLHWRRVVWFFHRWQLPCPDCGHLCGPSNVSRPDNIG